MKRILSLLLTVVMLSGVIALAEEPAPEATLQEAFCGRLMELLTDFDPAIGDQAAFNLASSGQEIASLLLKGADELIDLTVRVPSEEVDAQIQVSPEEAYLATGGSVVGVRFEDIPAIAEAAAKAALALQGITVQPDMIAAMDGEILAELFQMLLQTVIMKHVTVDTTDDGMMFSYTASGKELIADLCEFAGQVLAEEKYRPLLEQIWEEVRAINDGSDLPDLEAVIAMWPQAKESFLAMETDFSMTLKAGASNDYNKTTVNTEAGVPDDLFLLNLALTIDPEKGKATADAKLTERLTWENGEETTVRDYDILVGFDMTVRDGGVLWSFEINYPSQFFVLNMNGAHLDTAGRITLEMSNVMRSRYSFNASLDYGLDEDGFAGEMKVVTAYGVETDVVLALSERELSMTVNRGYSRDLTMRRGLEGPISEVVFSLKAVADENDVPQYALLTTEDFSVEYDGVQVSIVAGDVTVRCTGEFVSDHEYLITMTPEGESISDTSPAYIRVTFEGEEGDWNIHAALIEPEGSEYITANLDISPADPVESLGSAVNLMMLTPETVEQLMGMLLSR